MNLPIRFLTATTTFCCGSIESGGPERTRTSDLRFRKPLLYPAELRDQEENVAFTHPRRTLPFAAPAFVYEIPPQLQDRTMVSSLRRAGCTNAVAAGQS